MTSLKPGDVLASKYRLEEVIGRGGFATIYRATDTTINRPVAVKLLEIERQHGAARFVREARILGELQDPHTMRLFDFGRAEDRTLFMVVELLGGQDLSDLLAQRGRLTPAEAEHILRQLLSSLREAHAAGLLHRDVRPANIRVEAHGGDPLWVTLMDFGVARPQNPGAAKLTATGARIGTAAYMPPEQAVGGEIAPATDLFSLGLVIAQCLVGDLRPVRTSMMGTEPFDYGAPPQLTRALHAMLQIDIAERVRSADAVLAILDSSAPIAAPNAAPRQSGPHAQAPHSSRRVVIIEDEPDRRWVGVVGAVVSVALIVGVFAWGIQERQRLGKVPVRPSTNGAALTLRPAKPPPPEPASETADVAVVAPDAGPPTPDDPGCGEMPRKPGFDKRRTSVGPDVHRWRRYLPRDYDPSKQHPVLLAFHTDDGAPTKLTKKAHLRELADTLGMILIAFQGPRPVPWMAMYPDAAEQVLAQNRGEVCIDPERVFVLGYGSGGFPTENLSCEPWVRGVIFVSHRSVVDRLVCPDRAKPILFFQPMKSKHFPLEGGYNCSRTRKHVALTVQEEYLRTRNACDPDTKREVFAYRGSICFSWDCEAPLTICRVNGGHQFPGSGKRGMDVLNCDGPAPDFPYPDRFSAFLEPLL